MKGIYTKYSTYAVNTREWVYGTEEVQRKLKAKAMEAALKKEIIYLFQ